MSDKKDDEGPKEATEHSDPAAGLTPLEDMLRKAEIVEF